MRTFGLGMSLALVSLYWLSAAGAQAQYFEQAKVTTGDNFSSYYNQAPSTKNYITGAHEEPDSSPTPAPAVSGTCETCDYGWDDYCGYGTWRDNTIVSIGGESFKTIGDALPTVNPPGFMNSAGLVGTFNTGFTLIPDSAIRGQIGASYGIYDFKGRDTLSTTAAEQQTFFTLGVSKRSDILHGDALSWGLVYDQFWAHQWGAAAGELYVGQVRGLIGWALNERNEVGVWGTFRTTGDNSVSPMINPPPIRAMNQYNAFWRYNWDFGGQSMIYIGGNDAADVGSWLFGVAGQAPLSDYVSLYGNFGYDFPGSAAGVVGSNQEVWAFSFGLSYYFGGKAVSPSVSGPQGLPLLPVANNQYMFLTN